TQTRQRRHGVGLRTDRERERVRRSASGRRIDDDDARASRGCDISGGDLSRYLPAVVERRGPWATLPVSNRAGDESVPEDLQRKRRAARRDGGRNESADRRDGVDD